MYPYGGKQTKWTNRYGWQFVFEQFSICNENVEFTFFAVFLSSFSIIKKNKKKLKKFHPSSHYKLRIIYFQKSSLMKDPSKFYSKPYIHTKKKNNNTIFALFRIYKNILMIFKKYLKFCFNYIICIICPWKYFNIVPV